MPKNCELKVADPPLAAMAGLVGEGDGGDPKLAGPSTRGLYVPVPKDVQAVLSLNVEDAVSLNVNVPVSAPFSHGPPSNWKLLPLGATSTTRRFSPSLKLTLFSANVTEDTVPVTPDTVWLVP